jgi:hypothetical protein
MNELKYILYFFVSLFIGIQFFIPEKNIGEINPKGSFENEIETPADIKEMLSNACYDCHSNNTKYPWYASVAPMSWYVAGHVEDGKARLNFSTWSDYTHEEKQKKLDKNADLVKRRWMPMHEYLGQHPEALLTNDEVARLSDWFSKIQLGQEVRQCIDQ